VSDSKPAPAKLVPLSDAQRFELFNEALMRFLTMKPTHAPREDRSKDSQLSPTYRAAAWAMDALKSSEEIWRRESEWRANPEKASSQNGGGNGSSY